MSKLEISFHSFFLLPVPKREPKHGLNCSIVPGLPSLALPCCIAWYALSCTPLLHCIVLLEVCLEQRDVTEPCMHTAHKPSPKKAEMRRREKELNVNQSFPKIWAKYQCNVWGGVLVWLGLWSVFCWRASNPINHLYLALSPNLLSIQETLGERGVCLLFCYLTRLLMGQAGRYPLKIWGKTWIRSFLWVTTEIYWKIKYSCWSSSYFLFAFCGCKLNPI